LDLEPQFQPGPRPVANLRVPALASPSAGGRSQAADPALRESGRRCLPLRAVLRFLHLSPSRFQVWRRRQTACALDDRSSCPRMAPHELTRAEVDGIRDMVTAREYRHLPTGTLAVLAPRLGSPLTRTAVRRADDRSHDWTLRDSRPQARVWPAAIVMRDLLSKNRANVRLVDRSDEV